MREILFRGMRIYNGQWVYGDLIQFSDGQTYIKGNHQTIYEVIPETVGQYTGLNDKKEKKIFEGDIVKGQDYEEEDGYGVVKWIDGAFWVGNNHVCGTFCNNYYGYEFEIISNIHENHELLRVGE